MAKFSRAMRMNNPRDYARVFRQAKRSSKGGLTVLTAENSVGHPRLGLAIAKKHIKLATRRNALKRIIRTSFRQHQPMLTNIDIVVLSRADVSQREVAEVWLTLERHWQMVATQWQKS